MTLEPLIKSTIVRIIATAAFGSVLGCAAARPPSLAGTACVLDERLVCETFASSRSCRCTPDAEIDRVLASFGKPAWPGAQR